MSSVPVSSSAAAPPHPPHRPEPSPEREVSLHTCAVCAETRMTESDRNICVDCRRDICLNCGSSDEVRKDDSAFHNIQYNATEYNTIQDTRPTIQYNTTIYYRTQNNTSDLCRSFVFNYRKT